MCGNREEQKGQVGYAEGKLPEEVRKELWRVDVERH
jgi:hypothetical protein